MNADTAIGTSCKPFGLALGGDDDIGDAAHLVLRRAFASWSPRHRACGLGLGGVGSGRRIALREGRGWPKADAMADAASSSNFFMVDIPSWPAPPVFAG